MSISEKIEAISNHWFIKIVKAIGWTAGIVSVGFSIWAVIIAMEAREDTRKIAGLNLLPKLELNSSLNPEENQARGFIIRNLGPVKALQIEVNLIAHRYEIKDGKARVSSLFGTGEQLFRVKEINPFEERIFIVSDFFLDVNARIQKPEHNNILEIRISYRRPSDMKKRTDSAYYFVNPDGKWVAENNGSLTPDIYEPIKKAVIGEAKEMTQWLSIGFSSFSDPLHQIGPEQ